MSQPIRATRTNEDAKDIATALELARSYLSDKPLALRVIDLAFEALQRMDGGVMEQEGTPE